MTAEAAIQTNSLAKSYGRIQALHGLTMTVPQGEVFGFLGPNGAGKTTAVRLLLGLARPTSGGGTLLGRPLGDRGARREVGYLPELFRYQGWMRADEVLRFHCSLTGIARGDRGDQIERVLSTVGLTARTKDRVGAFSKGMQQRLGIGVALLGDPKLVFLDEPTSALDPVGRHDVRDIISTLAAGGATVFLNSHLLSEVERICQRVAIVDHGTIIATGSLDELLAGHDSVRIRVGDHDDALPVAARFGSAERDGDWIVVHQLPDDRIPDLVDALVAAKMRVRGVVPAHQSLEDRFLELLDAEASPS